MSTLKVWRLRLLTPMTFAPASSATVISASVFTSTSGSIPSARDAAISAASSSALRMLTMSSAVSARARASSSWYASITKSLRSTHRRLERRLVEPAAHARHVVERALEARRDA